MGKAPFLPAMCGCKMGVVGAETEQLEKPGLDLVLFTSAFPLLLSEVVFR